LYSPRYYEFISLDFDKGGSRGTNDTIISALNHLSRDLNKEAPQLDYYNKVFATLVPEASCAPDSIFAYIFYGKEPDPIITMNGKR
jgi:hypothetical protein